MKPFVVVFAGVPGSSKSIVAHYLSEVFGLPIFSNDNLRFEVREDLLLDDITSPKANEEYEKRSTARRREMLARGRSFILDASVDRRWATLKPELEQVGLRWFLIDMELSRSFMKQLYQKTGRPNAVLELDAYFQQHQDFMAKFAGEVHLKITDETFKDRLHVSEAALKDFLQNLEKAAQAVKI